MTFGLQDMHRTLCLLAGYFGAWNQRMSVLDLSHQTFLVLSIDEADSEAAVNLDCLNLGRVKEGQIVPA